MTDRQGQADRSSHNSSDDDGSSVVSSNAVAVDPGVLPWFFIRDALFEACAPMLLLLDCCHGGSVNTAHFDVSFFAATSSSCGC
jgi:hypothetical protein